MIHFRDYRHFCKSHAGNRWMTSPNGTTHDATPNNTNNALHSTTQLRAHLLPKTAPCTHTSMLTTSSQINQSVAARKQTSKELPQTPMPRKGKENALDGDEEDVEEMELDGQVEGEEEEVEEQMEEEEEEDEEQTGHETLRQRLEQVTDLNQYDPDQDKSERRDIRVQYRELLNRTEENRQDYVKPANDGLHQIVTEANQLYVRVKHTHEATLDSRLLVLSADLSTQRARNLKLNSTSFDMDEYVSKLVSFMGGRRDDESQLNWRKMGRVAVKYSSRVPTMDFMLGPLSIEQKARRTHRVSRLEKNKADLVQPQQLKESDMVHNSNQTTDNVSMIRHILMERGPIGFFEFVMNPESFGQTVENIFYLSFLIRDGVAKLEDVDGQLMLDYHEPPTNEEYEDGLIKKQLIVDMDMSMWREITEMLDTVEPVIPTRPKQAAISGKWYA